MISEIDIKDWDKSIKEARLAVDDLDDFARMSVSVTANGAVKNLEDFFNRVEKLVHQNQPQTPALFKPKK